MERREFLVTAAMAAAGSATLGAQAPGAVGRDYYEWTRYEVRLGPGHGKLNQYLKEAYFPALKRQGLGPLGAFAIAVGAGSPTLYTLVTLPSLDAFAASGQAGCRCGIPEDCGTFLGRPPRRPRTCAGRARSCTPSPDAPGAAPSAAAGNKPRIFEFRIYESPGDRGGDKKMEMFNSGEIETFRKTGLTPVFFGQTIAGTPMPSLHYMVTFADIAEREKAWAAIPRSPRVEGAVIQARVRQRTDPDQDQRLVVAADGLSEI